MLDFDAVLFETLIERFKNLQGLDEYYAEATAHALIDIAEAKEKIFEDFLPKLICASDKDAAFDAYWNIISEIRHIEYHLIDAGFMDEKGEQVE